MNIKKAFRLKFTNLIFGTIPFHQSHDGLHYWYCGKCGCATIEDGVGQKYNYCWWCGEKVRWKDKGEK